MPRIGLLRGPRALAEALRLLRRHRELWPLCALPFFLNLLIFGLSAWAFWSHLDMLTETIGATFAVADPAAWYQWLWVGPLRALAWLLRWILLAGFVVAGYFLFTLVGAVIAAPFLDALSERVERIRLGEVAGEQASLLDSLRGAGRSVLEESKRALFFIAVQAIFVLLAFVPGLQPVSVAGGIAFTMLFLPLDYTGYALDRRRVRFRQRRGWVWENRGSMLGFGGAALVSLLVPGLNFFCLPWFVTAGTLFALDVGPPAAEETASA